MNQLVLIVDDDPHIRDIVSFALEQAGFRVTEAGDGRQGLEQFNKLQPDLLVLDIMMPELDGLELCKELRKTSTTPIIFLTAMSDEVDSIIALELGGDDYLTKPFSPRQLVARARAVLRRTTIDTLEPPNNTKNEITVGQLYLNRETFKASWAHTELILTATEFNLIQALSARPNKVFSREDLMQHAYDNVVVSDRTIDSHIRRVRAKISTAGGHAIETVHGVGYKLGLCQ